jgi:cytochrome c
MARPHRNDTKASMVGYGFNSIAGAVPASPRIFDTLYDWIEDPKAFAPGNKMAFAGVNDARERANIVAFLDKQSAKPIPFSQK